MLGPTQLKLVFICFACIANVQERAPKPWCYWHVVPWPPAGPTVVRFLHTSTQPNGQPQQVAGKDLV